MNKDKLKGYESPNVELVELRFEGIVCESPNGEREVYGFYDLG